MGIRYVLPQGQLPGEDIAGNVHPVYDILQALSYQTPANVELKKLQFHQFQSSDAPRRRTVRLETHPHYQLHLFGQIDRRLPRSEQILEGFIRNLHEVGLFKAINLLHTADNPESSAVEFELVATV